MFLVAELKTQEGQLVAMLTVPPKDFKTGSKGFFGNTKAEIDGKRYQVQIQIVEIGSKKKTEEAE
ncbi:hypothetical protein LARV_02329 [Longilinea arvoryzae]|uniref:Uncharacterized protein n=1 Tax=Longilinea arvoryzae TaxID=360412 RepID=A0A0S7BAB5_9CHLR|nr:hypothetical protein [Longilinea arvoryzae]GAP14556.1 hypothetical protein LARV_02329 [Longilinea arvoryzae]